MSTTVEGKADHINVGPSHLTKNVSEEFKQETRNYSFNAVPVSITDQIDRAVVSIHKEGYDQNINVFPGTSLSGSEVKLPNLTCVYNRRDFGTGRKGYDHK